jgi:hypothetical protein
MSIIDSSARQRGRVLVAEGKSPLLDGLHKMVLGMFLFVALVFYQARPDPGSVLTCLVYSINTALTHSLLDLTLLSHSEMVLIVSNANAILYRGVKVVLSVQ